MNFVQQSGTGEELSVQEKKHSYLENTRKTIIYLQDTNIHFRSIDELRRRYRKKYRRNVQARTFRNRQQNLPKLYMHYYGAQAL